MTETRVRHGWSSERGRPWTSSVGLPISAYTPLKIAFAWLGGTYLLFLLAGETNKVHNLWQLSTYVGFTIACLIAGYWVRMIRYRSSEAPPALPDRDDQRADVFKIKALIVISAAHYICYGLVYMSEYGVASASALNAALSDPGSAYLAKFDVYERQAATGPSNLAAQILTLLAVFSAPLVPFLIVYWKRLTADIRLAGVLGLAVYSAFFLAIGTLSGIGYTLIYVGVALLVTRAQGSGRGISRSRRRLLIASAVVAGIAFAVYMSHNQGTRLAAAGVEYRYATNPLVEKLTNEQFAHGLTATASYPTHGYQGLAYNLGTSFEWTEGRGSSRALDSYLDQYGFGLSVAPETYPARTEARTGWPANQYWATIYPWLASDLTFPGAALFMVLVGWWMARWWYESVVLGSRLALLLLCQVAILIAFVPANNQLGISRPALISVTTLLSLYALSRLRTSADSKRRASRRTLMADVASSRQAGPR